MSEKKPWNSTFNLKIRFKNTRIKKGRREKELNMQVKDSLENTIIDLSILCEN